MLQFSPRIFVEGFEIKRILRRDLPIRKQTASISSEMFLVLYNFVERNLVLD